MQIVPLPGDTIVTKDGAELLVAGYNNFKSKGPAVFCKESEQNSQFITVYFFDIEKINDVRVEFSNSSKIFNALGRVKRKIHLPQPHDFIFVFGKNEGDENDNFNDSKKVKVVGYKLHNKKNGISKGLLIEDEDKNVYMLDEVLDLKREIGTTYFERKHFLRIYKDYLGHKP